MKKTYNELKKVHRRISYTAITAVVLCLIYLFAIIYVYRQAESNALENLHINTKEIKDDIVLQYISDRENLITMANFAAKLYENGEDMDIIIRSFNPIGLISGINILHSDGSYVTRTGVVDNPEELEFDEEVKKGVYISAKTYDITDHNKEIIRSAVPIKSNDETVAMLYGIINLDAFEERYISKAEENDAMLYVLEQLDGGFILDTQHNKVENISTLSTRIYTGDYTYEQLKGDIDSGKSGFSSFVSIQTGKVVYAHYSPIGVSDWFILLSVPANIVFAQARETVFQLLMLFLAILAVVVVYFIFIFEGERKQSYHHLAASNVRRVLLEINQQSDSIVNALKYLTEYSKARSAIFVDSKGESYGFKITDSDGDIITDTERKYIINKLLQYALQKKGNKKTDINVFSLNVDKILKEEYSEFANFLKKHSIENITYSYIVKNDDDISILGVINPQKIADIKLLLLEISVCFSMAVYNKKYLNDTERVAVTDLLTGLYNRVEYNKTIEYLEANGVLDVACIYVDVNELHYVNNKYGHAAGDKMLKCVAETMKSVFEGEKIYRVGGDEFYVFIQPVDIDEINLKISQLDNIIEEEGYKVSIGLGVKNADNDIESMIKEAEDRMYEAKAEYYRKKENESHEIQADKDIEILSTGMSELDALISVVSHHYVGVCMVSLDNDTSKRVIIPSYMNKYFDSERSFSGAILKYVHELVHADSHRAMFNFMNYDVIKTQLDSGIIPTVTYKKTNDIVYRLSVHKINDENNEFNTLWVFEFDK